MKDRYYKKRMYWYRCINDAGGQGGQCINGTDAWKGFLLSIFLSAVSSLLCQNNAGAAEYAASPIRS